MDDSGSGACTIASAGASPSSATTHSIRILKGQILVEEVVVGIRGRARLPAHTHSHVAVSEVLKSVWLRRMKGHCELRQAEVGRGEVKSTSGGRMESSRGERDVPTPS